MDLNSQQPDRDFHGAIIDEDGREIPITEDMIQRACQRLEQHWHYPTPQFHRAQKAGA
ncbi:MAG: hypothetical protein MI745_05370 [Pseudomonadales bacterium]|nr:hypothetical protein [Pseudomonadales bacterium]